jgi:hypothetical protein
VLSWFVFSLISDGAKLFPMTVLFTDLTEVTEATFVDLCSL